jgi:hypothetical protein
MGWDKFWAIFSQVHLVTLVVAPIFLIGFQLQCHHCYETGVDFPLQVSVEITRDRYFILLWGLVSPFPVFLVTGSSVNTRNLDHHVPNLSPHRTPNSIPTSVYPDVHFLLTTTYTLSTWACKCYLLVFLFLYPCIKILTQIESRQNDTFLLRKKMYKKVY